MVKKLKDDYFQTIIIETSRRVNNNNNYTAENRFHVYLRLKWFCWARRACNANNRTFAIQWRCRRLARTCATRSWLTGFSDTPRTPISRRRSVTIRRPPYSTPSRSCPAPPRTPSRYVCPPSWTLRICIPRTTADEKRCAFGRVVTRAAISTIQLEKPNYY